MAAVVLYSVEEPAIITREPRYFPPASDWRSRMGREAVGALRNAGRAMILLSEAIMSIRFVPTRRSRRETIHQMFVGGIKSLTVITVVATFTGMILALQTGIEMRRFGQEVYIGAAVMVSMLREMGPFMTGLILAASVGSSIAAQMGTMVVSEEIAALELMSINPVRYLVMPRLVAMMIMTPLLSFYSCIMGVMGGGIVGMTQLNVPWAAYIDNAIRFAENKDLFVGMLKAFLFGIIIVITACHQGFATTQGAVGVGNATRRTVILSFLSILVVGYMITRMFYV